MVREKTVSGAIPPQHLHAIARLVEEDVEMAAQRILFQGAPYLSAITLPDGQEIKVGEGGGGNRRVVVGSRVRRGVG